MTTSGCHAAAATILSEERDRSGHDIRLRDVVVDLPRTIALLPGEADLIASVLREVLFALFEEEEGKSKGQQTAGTPTAG